jgi:hypothetical protein
MEIKMNIPDYDKSRGFEFKWENNFTIEVKEQGGRLVIRANKEGLQSLVNQLLNLAQDHFSAGYHIHLDEFNSLEEGSKELVIEKM